MALNIKNPEVEALVAEVARITGRSKTETIRRAMQEELARHGQGKTDPGQLLKWLKEEVWPITRPHGENPPMSKAEIEEILGLGPDGV